MINLYWLTPTLLLTLGFPLLMIILGEIILRLQRRKSRFANLLITLRNLVFPFLASFIFLFQVLQLDRESVWVRLSETFLWVTLIYFGLTFVNQIFFSDAAKGSWQDNIPNLLLDLSRTILVLVGTAIVISNIWDIDLGGILTTLGVGSLVIGLALQDSLGNIFSGIALLFERPLSIGDWVEIGDSTGEVLEITWRSVHIYTPDKHLVIIPNSELAKGNFRNYSRPKPLHGVKVELGFSCDDPPHKVMQILKQTALETSGVYTNPEPEVFITGYGDFAITYETLFFVKDYVQGVNSRHEFNIRIWYVHQRQGLSMPYPIHEEYEYESTAATPEDLRQKAIQVLNLVLGWESVDRQSLLEICEQSTIENYAQGEVIIEQNTDLKSLFVLLEGEVELSIRDRKQQEYIVGYLFDKEMFGEKSALLSDQNSDVRVTALTDTQVLVIGLETLQTTLQRFPLLSHTLGEIMEFRRQQMKEILSTA